MKEILILGAGAMGSAFAFPCLDNKHKVTLCEPYSNTLIKKILSNRNFHPSLKLNLPKKIIFKKYSNELLKRKWDLVVVAVISKGIEWASIELSKVLKNKVPILILTKGLAINNNNYEVLVHKMERLLKKNGIKETKISAHGAPSLAKD